MNKLFNICLQTALVILAAKSVTTLNEADTNLLDNYLPACMQALAYYIDLLQYEPVQTTTLEPPFFVDEAEQTTTPVAVKTTSRTTTRKPTSSWFQSPSWWSSTTTVRPSVTKRHKPGLYAPYSSDKLQSYQSVTTNKEESSTKTPKAANTYALRSSNQPEGGLNEETIDYNIINLLPFSLTKDIKDELDEQDSLSERENLDNFLRSYDDRYGSNDPITGKKRVPPTKPYVEFLLIYDLLKRDAKAANLSKYEGYTRKLEQDLFELSNYSAQRQLYTLMKKLLDRKEIERSDVVTRVKSVVKDLGNGQSVISKSLMFYPPLKFVP